MQQISFKIDSETLVANIYSKADKLPEVLFLHGAGTATKERVNYLIPFFGERNLSCMTFDFSGHGESTGTLNESSLQKRIDEAHAAIALMDPERPLTIVGSSMGGHVALDMLKTGRVDTLILFCPAVYSDESVPVQFDQGFTELIRKENSRENSSLFDELQKFSGRLFIIIGDQDTVIPHGVIAKLIASAPKAKQKELIFVPGATHAIHTWLEAHPDDLLWVIKKLFEHLDN